MHLPPFFHTWRLGRKFFDIWRESCYNSIMAGGEELKVRHPPQGFANLTPEQRRAYQVKAQATRRANAFLRKDIRRNTTLKEARDNWDTIKRLGAKGNLQAAMYVCDQYFGKPTQRVEAEIVEKRMEYREILLRIAQEEGGGTDGGDRWGGRGGEKVSSGPLPMDAARSVDDGRGGLAQSSEALPSFLPLLTRGDRDDEPRACPSDREEP